MEFEGVVVAAGTVVASATVLAPLERISAVLRIGGEVARHHRHLRLPGPPPALRGAREVVRHIARTEGLRGLWRANVFNMLKTPAASAIGFAAKEVLAPAIGGDGMVPRMVAGGAAGAVGFLATTPLHFVHKAVLLDVAAPGHAYSGVLDCARKTARLGGVGGFYRGVLVSGSGVVARSALYFGLFDTAAPLAEGSLVGKFALGYAVSLSAGLGAYPFQTLYARMVSTSLAPPELRYRTSFAAVGHIVRHEGIRALWRGGAVHLASSVAGAAFLVAADEAKAAMRA